MDCEAETQILYDQTRYGAYTLLRMFRILLYIHERDKMGLMKKKVLVRGQRIHDNITKIQRIG